MVFPIDPCVVGPIIHNLLFCAVEFTLNNLIWAKWGLGDDLNNLKKEE